MEETIMSENNMTRTSKDMYYLKIAETVLERSTCLRRRYGAVIVNNDEIVSTGYNGAPRGEANCVDTGYCYREAHNIPKGERYEMCMSGDTVVKLLNGEYKTLKEIAELGMTDFWVYSIDVNTGNIVPAIAKLSRITGYAKKLLKVTFDNGRSLLCTPDHKFLMRDCTYKQAENLEYGDSVMPMYYNFARNSVGGNGYESVCNTISMRQGRLEVGDKCNTSQTPTHHLVYEYTHNGELNFDRDNELIHHKNGKIHDNEPSNLEIKSRSIHSKEHLTSDRIANFVASGAKGHESFRERLYTDDDFYKSVSDRGARNMKANWNNPEFREKMKSIQSNNGKATAARLNSDPEIRESMLRGKVVKGLNILIFRMAEAKDDTPINDTTYSILQSVYKSEGRGGDQVPKYKTILKHFDSLEDALDLARHYNHKVVSIEEIDYNDYVYDLYVPEFNNFAVDLGDNSCVFVHNCVAVHAEQNAIISASRKEMLGATIYIVGKEVATGSYANPAPCLICRRMIRNAGITKCIGLVDGEPKEISLEI